jgi:uncharacterized membrane protein YphA (DoxX/SURF4 family)
VTISKLLSYLACAITFGIGTLLIVAACLKALQPEDAQRFVRAVAPSLPARAIVAATCVLEWAAGVLLLSGVRRQLILVGVACAAIVLSAIFWYARSLGFVGRCGCLGGWGGTSMREVFARNGLLAIACSIAVAIRNAVNSWVPPVKKEIVP